MLAKGTSAVIRIPDPSSFMSLLWIMPILPLMPATYWTKLPHPDSRKPGPSSPEDAPMTKVHQLQWPHPKQSPFGKDSLPLPHIQRSANNTLRQCVEQQKRRPHIQRSTNNTLRPRAEQRQRSRWYIWGSRYVEAS
eukprot:scaffold317233_cov46-Attheya_sp.AAC.1